MVAAQSIRITAHSFLGSRDTPRKLSFGRHILAPGRLYGMTYQDDALRRLDESGVLDAIRWAAHSAGARTLADFSEAAGHDAAWLGTTRHVLFKDRLDRVLSLGKYYVPKGSDWAAGMDVVLAELTPGDIASMPVVPPGTVTRANIHGSPGWSTSEDHFLIQSFQPGKVDQIRWERKSETKQEVARQRSPDALTLFELPAQTLQVQTIDVAPNAPVLVVAHALNPTDGRSELYLGLPSSDHLQGRPWHWRCALHYRHPPGPGAQLPLPRHPTGPNDVADAPVRLRNQEPERGERTV
jgi:hypothetical protein